MEFDTHLDNHKIVTDASSLRFLIHAGEETHRMDDSQIEMLYRDFIHNLIQISTGEDRKWPISSS